jgi:polyribonucleotide nucleotidyltransferase
MAQKTFTREIGGKDLIIETGKLAGQANGSVTVRYGDTVVLATATMSNKLREGINYFPLMVDYEERLYAAGKIKGSRFIKREGRASDEAILTARMVDRSIRPLFPVELRNDVQVVITVLSVDQENDPDVLSLIGASCALAMSNIPWNGPLAGSRVSMIEGEWALNPTYAAREKAVLDLVVAGTKDRVIMIEAGAKQVDEDKVFDAIEFSQKHTRKVVELIEEVVAAVGSPKEMPTASQVSDEDKATRTAIEEKVKSLIGSRLAQYFDIKDKAERNTWLNKLREELDASLKSDNDVSKEQRARSRSRTPGVRRRSSRGRPQAR